MASPGPWAPLARTAPTEPMEWTARLALPGRKARRTVQPDLQGPRAQPALWAHPGRSDPLAQPAQGARRARPEQTESTAPMESTAQTELTERTAPTAPTA